MVEQVNLPPAPLKVLACALAAVLLNQLPADELQKQWTMAQVLGHLAKALEETTSCWIHTR